MQERSKVRQYRTRVGRAIHGDNLFYGRSVKDDIVGKKNLWQILSMAVNGPELTPFQCAFLDAMAGAGLAADPRIWPLKATRVAGAYGDFYMSLGTALVLASDTAVGPSYCEFTARIFLRFDELLRAQPQLTIDEVVSRVKEEQGGRLAGFGVPGRQEDERYLAISTWFDQNCPGPEYPVRYWTLCQELRPIMERRFGIRPNWMACVVVLLLDMGFDVHQLTSLSLMALFPCYFANAYEGSCVPEARLPERIDSSLVTYAGKPA